MVVIRKGDKTLTIPTSAFNTFYKNAGWDIVGESKKNKKISENEPVEEEWDGSEEDWDSAMKEEEEVEKPLSEMNRQELEKKANSLGVDITGLTTNKQIREAIRSYER